MNQTPLEKAHEALRARREAGEEIVIEHNLMKKAAADPKSKVKAIHAFCYNCMGGTIDEMPDPGWKDAIRTCTAPGCPLYQHRPYKGVHDRTNRTGHKPHLQGG